MAWPPLLMLDAYFAWCVRGRGVGCIWKFNRGLFYSRRWIKQHYFSAMTQLQGQLIDWPLRHVQWSSQVYFFQTKLWINIFSNSCVFGLRWVPENTIKDKSALLQIMAWCYQATSHNLRQCWTISLLLYNVTRPQWVNYTAFEVSEWMNAYIPQ